MVWFLSLVHLVQLFELFWLVCLVSGVLMFRVLSSGHYCLEWYKITLTRLFSSSHVCLFSDTVIYLGQFYTSVLNKIRKLSV